MKLNKDDLFIWGLMLFTLAALLAPWIVFAELVSP